MAGWIIGISMLLSAEPNVNISHISNYQTTQNVIVVCPEKLQDGLTAWVTARQKSNWQVHVVRPRINAQETLGTIKQFAKRASYVILVGNCQLPSIAAIDPRWQTPTFYVETPIAARFGSTESAATDLPYGDIDGDGIPEASVDDCRQTMQPDWPSFWTDHWQRKTIRTLVFGGVRFTSLRASEISGYS